MSFTTKFSLSLFWKTPHPSHQRLPHPKMIRDHTRPHRPTIVRSERTSVLETFLSFLSHVESGLTGNTIKMDSLSIDYG